MLLFLGALAGALMASQAPINNRLKASVGSPWVMTTISFIIGTAMLMLLVVVVDDSFLPPSSVFATTQWWMWIGGVIGVIALTATVLLLPRLGAVQNTICMLTGQVMTGVILDQFGWLNTPVHMIDTRRLIGVILLLVGAWATVLLGNSGNRALRRRAEREHPTGTKSRLRFLLQLGALGVGAMLATQGAVNGQLGQEMGSAVKSATTSFTIGVVCLLIFLIIMRPKLQFIVPQSAKNNPWWMWLGGIIGGIYVFAIAALVPVIGAGLTMMAVQIGMLAGSLFVDHFGLFGVAVTKVKPLQLLTLLVMVGGVALIG